MKRFAWIVIVLIAMPLSATAGLFGLGESKDVAIKVMELAEDAEVGTMDFSPDAKYLAVDLHGNGGTNVWDLEQKRIVSHMPEGGTYTWDIELIKYNPNGRQLAICHGSNPPKFNVTIYDPSTGAVIHSIQDEDTSPMSGHGCGGIAFTPDGKELIRLHVIGPSPWYPGEHVTFYDTSTWKITRGIRTGPLKALIPTSTPNKWSQPPDNSPFLSTPDMLLLDPDNKAVSFSPSNLSISKDGRFLALAGNTDILYRGDPRNFLPSSRPAVVIVDISKPAIYRVISSHSTSMYSSRSLDWSPDNINIAFGPTHRAPIQIFDSRTGELVTSEGDHEPVTSEGEQQAHVLVRYTSDGKYMIEKIEKRVEIWDGKHQNKLQEIRAEPSYIAVSRDGHYFAIGGAENNILDIDVWVSLFIHPNGPKGKVLVYKLQ
jgi:WD40 repeat protein